VVTTQAFKPTEEHKMPGDDDEWPYLEYEVGEVFDVSTLVPQPSIRGLALGSGDLTPWMLMGLGKRK
jgi:hypothetical protein